jgi:hypothetical protein
MALPFLQAKNNVVLKLAEPLLAADDHMVVVDAAGIPPLFPFPLTIQGGEIVRVTSAAGTTLSIDRETEGTTALASVAAGRKATLSITAAFLQELQSYIDSFANILLGTVNTSTNHTVSFETFERNILVNASGGNRTVTLPSTSVVGVPVAVKKTDSSRNTVTVAPTGSTIDGASTYVLELQGEFVQVVRDNAGAWQVVAE